MFVLCGFISSPAEESLGLGVLLSTGGSGRPPAVLFGFGTGRFFRHGDSKLKAFHPAPRLLPTTGAAVDATDCRSLAFEGQRVVAEEDIATVFGIAVEFKVLFEEELVSVL